jgi:hypothetical protein
MIALGMIKVRAGLIAQRNAEKNPAKREQITTLLKQMETRDQVESPEHGALLDQYIAHQLDLIAAA